MNNNIVKHIIFDVDGTIVNNDLLCLKALQYTVKKLLNRYIELEDLSFAIGMPSKMIWEHLGFLDYEMANDTWEEYYALHNDEICLFNGIVKQLYLLKDNFKLGIITSRNKNELLGDPIMKDILGLFDSFITYDDTIKHKPDPQPLLKYLENNSLTAKEVIYIGDTQYDSLCASGANVKFIQAMYNGNLVNYSDSSYVDDVNDIWLNIQKIM
ncbi:MAG: HAD-IA family hydrolase [Erysipelotrichaceae bacterium]